MAYHGPKKGIKRGHSTLPEVGWRGIARAIWTLIIANMAGVGWCSMDNDSGKMGHRHDPHLLPPCLANSSCGMKGRRIQTCEGSSTSFPLGAAPTLIGCDIPEYGSFTPDPYFPTSTRVLKHFCNIKKSSFANQRMKLKDAAERKTKGKN